MIAFTFTKQVGEIIKQRLEHRSNCVRYSPVGSAVMLFSALLFRLERGRSRSAGT